MSEDAKTTPNGTSAGAKVDFSAIRAIAFDCYGTLIDFGDTHFIDIMGVVALQNALQVEGKALFDRWLAASKEVWRERGRDPDQPTAGPEPRFGTYTEIWAEMFARAFAEMEASGDAEGAHDLLVERLSHAPPYAETHEVIAALRPHYRLSVLSNADDAWLQSSLGKADLRFELVVSSESAQSYKPRAKIFHDTAALLGLPPEQILYVGDSPVADVLGAKHAGMPVAWVNRYGATRPDNVPAPDLEITDLRGLLEPLLAVRR
ncbi:MAG TPA: HAD-IA family hydrolase [Dehalococcoidia bacterium]|nr:HAD-IA family hydrolase [Dehalococcoidia bacterium]